MGHRGWRSTVRESTDQLRARTPPLNLSIDEAASALGVSSRTVRYMVARKELPVVRIGRRVLVSWEALVDSIEYGLTRER